MKYKGLIYIVITLLLSVVVGYFVFTGCRVREINKAQQEEQLPSFEWVPGAVIPNENPSGS